MIMALNKVNAVKNLRMREVSSDMSNVSYGDLATTYEVTGLLQ